MRRHLGHRPCRLIGAGVLSAMAGLLLTAPAAAATSALSVRPGTVHRGGAVAIFGRIPNTGAKSCPEEDAATIVSDAALFPPDGFGPSAARNASGAFRVTYTVPTSTPPATYRLGVRCGGGNVGVSAKLRVT